MRDLSNEIYHLMYLEKQYEMYDDRTMLYSLIGFSWLYLIEGPVISREYENHENRLSLSLGWQDRKLRFHLCGTLRVIQHLLEQFLANLISHRIRNYHNRALFCIAQIAIIEVALERNLLECTGFLNTLVPLGHDFTQVLVGLDVFNQSAEAFKSSRILDLVKAVIEISI